MIPFSRLTFSDLSNITTMSPPPPSPKPSRQRLQRIPATAGSAPILSALRADGAVIITSLFPPSAISLLNTEINPLMSPIAPGSTQPSPFIQAFHGPTTKRLNNLVGRSPTFRSLFLENDLIHECCSALFVNDSGGYWMNSAQVIDIPPGSAAQPLHRDQWQFPVFTLVGPEAPEASCNFIVALSGFTDENGATRVIPGSHAWKDMSDNGRAEDSVAAEMEVGDVCFISGKVVHGGGANVTEGETRRGLAMVFQASYLTPEEAFPFNVEREVARGMSERGQRMVGFRSQALKDSPGVWKRDYREGEEVYC